MERFEPSSSDHDQPVPRYRLDELGWLQFERVCSLVLKAEAGLGDLGWLGHADRGRVALIDGSVALACTKLRGPVTVAIVWAPADERLDVRIRGVCQLVMSLQAELGAWSADQLLLLTNLDSRAASDALCTTVEPLIRYRPEDLVVLGAGEIGESLDRHWQLRAAMPSVLGVRDVAELIEPSIRRQSTLDVAHTQELARVFWPTRAYGRARDVLVRHRFVVLTGPPEMGKTAIAQMLALAQLTAGWEAHETTEPGEVVRAFDRSRSQLFIADDAFGSTEYRPDAAERWARALGRLLGMLDDRHWLIWTSRPAPLKAGLRRVQRERGSERFPEPGEVLVDASELDLAEKTLILFRHAKARGANWGARWLVRREALTIVEHPHFTPERIRRFVTDRLEHLAGHPRNLLRLSVERELASPTDAMRTSFQALGREHRELLIALLDAPAGLIGERELAVTVRRHRTGGLSRPPAELIDRLTDHFLRVTPLGIGWVHPSWRDLVMEQLREDAVARVHFLECCGIEGAVLALSHAGGIAGERTLPLLVSDGDWDVLGDRACQLLRELEDQELQRLLLALNEGLCAGLRRWQRREATSLAERLLRATRCAWDQQHRALPAFLLEAWYRCSALVAGPLDGPELAPTWLELHPCSLPFQELSRSEQEQIDEWLVFAQVLARRDPDALRGLGFPDRDQEQLGRLIGELTRIREPDLRPLAQSILNRIMLLAPDQAEDAAYAAMSVETHQAVSERHWWVPEDITALPSLEPVQAGPVGFTRADVKRVLQDL